MLKIKTPFMKWIFLIITLFVISCSPKIIRTKEYKMAIEELTYNENKENLKLVSEPEIKRHEILFFNGDTINLEKDNKVFAIRIIQKNKIFIYQFNKTGIYKRIECDSSWRVKSINYLGDIY